MVYIFLVALFITTLASWILKLTAKVHFFSYPLCSTSTWSCSLFTVISQPPKPLMILGIIYKVSWIHLILRFLLFGHIFTFFRRINFVINCIFYAIMQFCLSLLLVSNLKFLPRSTNLTHLFFRLIIIFFLKP